LRYLRRIDDLTRGALRWDILTDGARWRLYFAGARSAIDEYLELDLARIMGLDGDLQDSGIADADRDHWLRVLATLFHRNAFEAGKAFTDRLASLKPGESEDYKLTQLQKVGPPRPA
jgi:hypothetical protein